MYGYIRSGIDRLRDTYAPITNQSTFRNTGQITPEEFLQAGDFLVYKFPSWSWADASSPDKRVAYLPTGKQYLVTRGVPCRRRLDDNFAGDAGLEDFMVRDGEAFQGTDGADDGWLSTGGGGQAKDDESRSKDVRTVDETGEQEEDEEEIPDMEDEDDDEDAIIRDPKSEGAAPLRTYTLYITYTPYYRTPRLYLSGYESASSGSQPSPLPPTAMMEDIVGDYKDKTVTLEDFPFTTPTLKTASVHPCRHASVMKVLLDRADAALKIRTAKMRQGVEPSKQGMEGLVDQTRSLKVTEGGNRTEATSAREGDEWDLVDENAENDEVAIRVDQYLVVFLKFMASVTPGIEHDYTMGV